MRAFLSIVGLLCVIAGFVVLYIKRKRRKDELAITVGIVEEVEKRDGINLLKVRYKLPYENEIVKGKVSSKKPYREGMEILLDIKKDGLAIYNDDRRLLFLAFFLLIIGELLCMVA